MAVAPDESPVLRRLCFFTSGLIFPLIWVGGLVTSYDAGMSVPDWPTTYGYNLFLYPISTWFFGPWDVFVEHSHRLLGSVVGIAAFTTAAVAAWRGRSIGIALCAGMLFIAVVLQGVLGGARVLFDEGRLGFFHGVFGHGIFCGYVCLAVASGSDLGQLGHGHVPAFSAMALLAGSEVVVGAGLRHLVNQDGVNSFGVLLIVHLITAVTVFGVVCWVMVVTRCRGSVGMIMAMLMVGQIGLGVGSYLVKYGSPATEDGAVFEDLLVVEKFFFQALVVTSHVALGALLSALSASQVVRWFRINRRQPCCF